VPPPVVAPLQPQPPAHQFFNAPPAIIRGGIPPATSTRTYRLQVGAYGVARNAVTAFERLQLAGLNPAYERYNELYRVVLPGLRAGEIQTVAQILGNAGFTEALIREE